KIIDEADQTVSVKTQEVNKIQSEKKRLETSIDEISKRRAELEEGIKNATAKLNDVQALYEIERVRLAAVEDEYYKLHKSAFLGDRFLPETFTVYLNSVGYEFKVFTRENSGEIARMLKTEFLQPISIAKKNLESITAEKNSASADFVKRILVRFLEEYASGIERKGHYLNCSVPDFASWEASFSAAFTYDDSIFSKCKKLHVDRLISLNKWSESDVLRYKEASFFQEHESKSEYACSTSFEYEIEKLYRDKWRYVTEPCRDRLLNVDEIVLRDINDLDIAPERSSGPPSKEEINRALDELIAGWY